MIEKGHKKESGANRCACFIAFCDVALAAIHVKPVNKNKTKILDFMVILSYNVTEEHLSTLQGSERTERGNLSMQKSVDRRSVLRKNNLQANLEAKRCIKSALLALLKSNEEAALLSIYIPLLRNKKYSLQKRFYSADLRQGLERMKYFAIIYFGA